MKNKSVISLLIAFTLLVTLTIPVGVTAAPKEAEEEPARFMRKINLWHKLLKRTEK